MLGEIGGDLGWIAFAKWSRPRFCYGTWFCDM